MTSSVYYNEIAPYCAQWLSNLMVAGLIPRGDIDTRSIEDVRPGELRGYTQCHFFAGLGGWSYALQLAGWGARPVWTGSCPCQPFSAAGKGTGIADERHLWPAWQHLIAQCRPPIVFGEQVASKAADAWIDLVHADLENMDYAFGCVPFPAGSVGAPHRRERNYWVADTYLLLGGQSGPINGGDDSGGNAQARRRLSGDECFSGVADTADIGYSGGEGDLRVAGGWPGQGPETHGCGNTRRLADSDGCGLATQTIATLHNAERHSEPCGGLGGLAVDDRRTSAGNSFWSTADWLKCRDGKWRPAESGTCPLAHGIPNRVGRLRAYGNAIVPQATATFVTAYMQARGLIEDQRRVAA